MDQHTSLALNALLATDDNYYNRTNIAKNHIKELSTYQKYSLRETVSREQQQQLIQVTIQHLVNHIEFGHTVASLFGYSLARFIYLHLDIVIPYVHRLPLHNNNNNNNYTAARFDTGLLMNTIASEFSMSIQKLYQDYGYFAIVHWLLLDPAIISSTDRQAYLDSICLDAQPYLKTTKTTNTTDHIAKQLLGNHVTRATGILSMELWHSNHQYVRDALEKVKTWAGFGSASFTDYLLSYMLSIINYANEIMKDPSKQTHHPLASLVVLLGILGPKSSSFIPQLLDIGQTAMVQMSNRPYDQQEECLNECCLYWNGLLGLTGQEPTVRHFMDIIRCMLKCLPLCGNRMTKMVDELTQAIKTHVLSNDDTDDDNSVLKHLPEFPPYPELDSLRQWIEDEKQEHPSRNNNMDQVALAHLIVRMSTNETIPSLYSLQNLERLLILHQTTLYTHELVWPLLGELYDVLLGVIKQYAYRYDLCGLASSCLGLLGAVDPSRLVSGPERYEMVEKIKNMQQGRGGGVETTTTTTSMGYTSDMIVINNYMDPRENQVFAIHLIVHYFYPVIYSKADGGDMKTCSQYAIQQLLKAVGIRFDNTRDQHTEEDGGTWQLWHSLDSSIRDVMEPLLYSKYEANVHIRTFQPPFYQDADSFMKWTKNLCYFLLDKIKDTEPVDASHQMMPIFQACIPSIKVGHALLTQHVIPFLVLRVLLSSPNLAKDQKLIVDEMVGILKHGAIQKDMKQSALQLIVSITGHCQKWIRQRLHQQQMKRAELLRLPSISLQRVTEGDDIKGIRRFLAQIPNHLMAEAAFRTGNYPQALMHYESTVKEIELSKSKTKRQRHIDSGGGSYSGDGGPSIADILEELCQTYMHLEGPEAMGDVLGRYNHEWTKPMEVLRFESLGEWASAKVAYEHLLPTDPSLTSRYFHCLHQLGDYDHMATYASNLLDTMAVDDGGAETEQHLKMVNRYRAEAAWKSGNWSLLHECLRSPMDDSFDASVARVLAKMQKNEPLAVYFAIQDAQVALIQHISQTKPESYQQSYGDVLRFHLLHELDSVMVLSSSSSADDTMAMTTTTAVDDWKMKFSMTKPSYQTQRQLMDLRLAAQFDIWKPDNMYTTDGISEMERGLRLLLAKNARKAGDSVIALKAIYQANRGQEENSLAKIELSKWYHAQSNGTVARAVLSHPCVKDEGKARFLLAKYISEQLASSRPANDKDALQRSQEFKKVDTIYADLRREFPDWEKLHMTIGAWEERRSDPKILDIRYYRRAYRAIKFYCDALKSGCKYYYSTMPRLLSLWLQIVDAYRVLNDGTNNIDDKLADMITVAYQTANTSLLESADDTPPYLFALTLPRLVSRLAISDENVAMILAKIILNVFIAYPRTTIWALQFALNSQERNLKNISHRIIHQAQISSSDPLLPKIISQMQRFTKLLEALSKEKCPKISSAKLGSGSLMGYTTLLNMTNLDLCIPHQRALIPRLPESTTTSTTRSPFAMDIPTIANILPDIKIMSSLQRPKRIEFKGNDGKVYGFLLKMNDDLRKDARSMEFSHMINHFLMKDTLARQQRLYIRTYAVTPLSNNWGLIEWIENLNPLKEIIRERWEADGLSDQHYERLRKTMRHMDGKPVDEKLNVLVKDIYPNSPVVFYRWFLDLFPEPSEWYASRSRFIKTLAVMSIVGHVLGLGDRHADNIMFDALNGDTVHVDVNLLFDFGKELNVPEIVPFRLTRNLVDAMGTPKETGLFKRSCMTTLIMLREYRSQLLSVFETFLHDPITDKRRRDTGLTREQVARKEIDTMSNKIHSKVSPSTHVDRLIKEATSERNLAQMYSGWSSFL